MCPWKQNHMRENHASVKKEGPVKRQPFQPTGFQCELFWQFINVVVNNPRWSYCMRTVDALELFLR